MKTFGKKYFNRILALVLALSMIFSLGVTNIVSIAETSAAWSGEIAAKYESGTGSENDPYIIKTAEQLALLVNDNDTSGKYYKLAADIVINNKLDGNAKPWYYVVGSNTDIESGVSFKGNFDGDGHTVSGLYYNDIAQGSNQYWFGLGLFPRVDTGVTIENVGLINSSLTVTTASGGAGAIVGVYSEDSSANNNAKLIIRNCFADNTVEINAANVGGIAYILHGDTEIRDCYVTAALTGRNKTDAFFFDGWGGSVNIYTSYTTTQILAMNNKYCNGSTYTTSTGNEDSDVPTAAYAINGDAASDVLTTFDFDNVWMETNGLPVLRVFYKNRANEGVWSGAIADSYAGGDGTKANPYKIANGEQLARLVNDTDTLGKYYELTANIVLNKNLGRALSWYGVAANGDGSAIGVTFGGHFNGNGYTVSGLYYYGGYSNGTSKDWYGVGLFPRVDKNAVIEKVGVTNSAITVLSGGSAGAIVGTYFPTSSDDSANYLTISQCYADDTVSITAERACGMAGALQGSAQILDCYFTGAFSGTSTDSDVIYGMGWTNSVHVYNFYTTSAIKSRGRCMLHNSAYTTASNSAAGIVVTDAQLIGTTAANTLSVFDFTNTWATVDGSTPILKIFKDRVRLDKGLWTGVIAEAYADGDGTAANPYEIANGEQLAKLAKDTETAGKYYVITADIKLNDMTSDELFAWYTHYDSNIKFQGNLNGMGHTVSGIYYNSTVKNGHRSGMLPVIGAGAVITNISFEDCDLTVGCFGGTVAGYSEVAAGEVFPEISYINVEETVSLAGNTIGGILGGGTVANFDNCCFTGTLTGVDMVVNDVTNTAKANGIVGNLWGVGSNIFYNISNCYSYIYFPFNYENVLAVCKNVYSGSTSTLGGVIGGKKIADIKADAKNQLPNLNWKDVRSWEEGELPYLNLNVEGNYNNYELGDTDCDGAELGANDLIAMRKYLLGNGFAFNADVTENGTVDILDLIRLKKLLSVA